LVYQRVVLALNNLFGNGTRAIYTRPKLQFTKKKGVNAPFPKFQ
jgi:hypothetical protein